jgi:dGTPase
MSNIFEKLICKPENSKGRVYLEKPSLYRNEFARDKDRIIHSNSFRRLEYKTQVFINHEGDHYRNRLTHSLEVASIGRSIAKYLGLSEDLTEGISLGHDLGHTAFGHAGERALNQAMLEYGGFSHNLHTFKILVELEKCYGAYDGLNLTAEVLEGILKHNGPIDNPSNLLLKYDEILDLQLTKFSSLESQISSFSDDIAYLTHDIEDAIRSNLLSFEDFSQIVFIDKIIQALYIKYPNIEKSRLAYELSRNIIAFFIDDLIRTTIANVQNNAIKSVDDVKNFGEFLVSFSIVGKQNLKELKQLFIDKVYNHESITLIFNKTNYIIQKLFEAYKTNPVILPQRWYNNVYSAKSEAKLFEIVGDYIAGMTDRYAISEFERIYQINFNDIQI